MVAITKNTGTFIARRPQQNTVGILDLPRKWFKRHDLRQQLAQMDAHMLRDIGWSEYDARREAAKPFWQA
ncbi:DUF1127 domain-containing protein [Thalassospira sp. MA62]|nr:DUF1127 domain-containing protein [Thalassospira sp. MA62]